MYGGRSHDRKIPKDYFKTTSRLLQRVIQRSTPDFSKLTAVTLSMRSPSSSSTGSRLSRVGEIKKGKIMMS